MNQITKFILGVEEIYNVKESQDMVVVGRLIGTVHVGDAVYISNPGADNEPMQLTVINGIEITPNKRVDEATDCRVALFVDGSNKQLIRKASVLFTRSCTVSDVHKVYINTLGDVFIAREQLNLPEEEMNKLSVTDCAEIWRLYSWFCKEVMKKNREEEMKEVYEKIDRLAGQLCKKLMESDEIYCVFNKATGEPHMFSKTIANEDGSYKCTPPDIRIFTKAYESYVKGVFPEDIFEIRKIENGEKRDGIYNFLGSTFYLNGACGVQILSEDTAINANMIVPEPDYSNIPKQNIPVTNPDLMRWMLLMGQIGDTKEEEEKLIYSLYYGFLSKEIVKANFIIPVKEEDDIPRPDKDGVVTLEKDTTIQFPVMDGKKDRQAIRMFTDWKRLRMVYDESWNGLVQPIEGMINVFDCVINSTQYIQAGIYVDKDMYDSIKLQISESKE